MSELTSSNEVAEAKASVRAEESGSAVRTLLAEKLRSALNDPELRARFVILLAPYLDKWAGDVAIERDAPLQWLRLGEQSSSKDRFLNGLFKIWGGGFSPVQQEELLLPVYHRMGTRLDRDALASDFAAAAKQVLETEHERSRTK